MDSSGNTVDATNLTGQVSVDSFTPQFKGNYSHVYQGVLEGQLVIGFPHRMRCPYSWHIHVGNSSHGYPYTARHPLSFRCTASIIGHHVYASSMILGLLKTRVPGEGGSTYPN
jgi:hypothetical protein